MNSTAMRLAERHGLSAPHRESLRESLAFMERAVEGLGFCLSEDGDLLSQWRGYADDARGLSIGFSREYLIALGVHHRSEANNTFVLKKVTYDPSEQEELIDPTFQELRNLIDAGAFGQRGSQSLLDSRTPEQVLEDDKRIAKAYNALLLKTLKLVPRLYELKAPAFREEREWRLVCPFIDAVQDSCQFRISRGRIVPYRSFTLEALASPAISEIILGPRNETPAEVIQSALRQFGFGDATVSHSKATYR